jgi:site-specific recombinase XerD
MAQHSKIALPDIDYNRTDYAALRAYCSGIPVARIGDLYYASDSPEVENGLERHLKRMRDHIVERSIERNPEFAKTLQTARLTRDISTSQLGILVQAAEATNPGPNLDHRLGQWFRPTISRLLREEGITTIGELVNRIERRGAGWWRALPRIGARRADAIVRWLSKWPEHLGQIDAHQLRAPANAVSAVRPVLDPRAPNPIAPLGTFQLPPYLAGVDGINRAPAFCFIAARDDLEAVDTFLARYDDSPETQRSYRKELERLLLWCALVARKPLSSMLAEDCLAYRTFLAAPDPRFCGPRAPRNTERWRPFDEKPMKPQSQRLAVVILRSAFDWLIKVRYLGGNPWVTVKDPAVTKRKHMMKIDRALRRDTWETVVEILQRLGEVEANRQDRVALAALLLMGDSGLRRAEVVSALRANFIPSPNAAGVWMLTVEGKRKVERDVPVNSRTEEALRTHWRDRDLDFDEPTRRGYLIAPIVTPVAKAEAKRQAREQRANEMGTEEALAELEQGNSYHVNSLYYVVDAALRRVRTFAAALSLYEMPAFSQDEIIQLQRTSPHAFRHTYATNAVEDNVPMEVVQDVLGHVNIMTTKVYAKTRQRRIAQEAAKQFARNEDAAEKRRRERT